MDVRPRVRPELLTVLGLRRNGDKDKDTEDSRLDELIARSLQGCTSEEEEEYFRRWRTQRAEHEERYQEAAAVWRATRSYEPRLRLRPLAYEAIVAEGGRRRIEMRTKRSPVALAGIAAALIIGFAVALWSAEGRVRPHGSEFVTGEEETATARLRDGTVVRLGPRSRLVVPPDGMGREVVLVGRAFFAVAEDRGRPFVVRTSAGDATALGTRFEVSVRERDLRLVVLEGRVAVSAGGKEVEVESHRVSHVRDGAEPSVVEVDDVWPLLGWMGGFMAFESTPLVEVGRELERRFGLKLVVEDAELSRQTVTVWFADDPLDRVVGVLCRLVEASCVVQDSTVWMTSAR